MGRGILLCLNRARNAQRGNSDGVGRWCDNIEEPATNPKMDCWGKT
jgi:hypothetical protein